MSRFFSLREWFSLDKKSLAPLRNRLRGNYESSYKSLSRSEYYSRLNSFRTNADFISLLENNRHSSVPQYDIDLLISPLDIPFLTPEAEVRRIKGAPRFMTERKILSRRHHILFYRQNLDGFEFIAQFHFIQDALMMVKQDVSYANKERDVRLLDLIMKKYGITIPGVVVREHAMLRITDKAGNCLLLRQGYKTELTWSNLTPEFSKALLKEEKISRETQLQIERSTERRIMYHI